MNFRFSEKRADENKFLKNFWLCILAGVVIRFVFMSLGNHFDFGAYQQVGALATEGKNIYASTRLYNYGPVWFILLGTLWKSSLYFAHNILSFKIFIVSLLTMTDFLIAKIISDRTGNFWGAVFFLNPISMVVSGYSNQFDNIAVLIAAYGVSCLEKSSRKYDIAGVILLSLSLITKHILFAFPLWILFNKNIDTRRKILYAFVPPLVFFLSFAQYWNEGANGIINNVFLYKSFNNFPLLAFDAIDSLGFCIPFRDKIGLPIFFALMAFGAYIFRREKIFDMFLLYTMSLVCFSSGIISHYFIIPCMALVIFFHEKSVSYFVFVVLLLSCDESVFRIPFHLQKHYGIPFNIITRFLTNGIMYSLVVWCLLFYLVSYIRREKF